MHIRDDAHASYKLLGTEFAKRGYTVTEEQRDGHTYVTYTSPSGAIWSTRAALLRYPCISEHARYVSRHKEVAYRIAEDQGITVPHTLTYKAGQPLDDDDLRRMLQMHTPLVVKPSNASLSRGLTLDVTTNDELVAAIKKSQKVSPTTLIQEEVAGEELRFVVMNGTVVSILLRQTPRVIGDGTSTLGQLIEQENQARRSLTFDYITYPQLDDTMIDQTLLDDQQQQRVLAKDEIVELSQATMVKNGCSIYDVKSQVDPSYLQTAERLAGTLDTRFIVVDMILKDYTKPQTDNNYWFIEFNTSPILKLFYGCRDHEMFDIVPKLVTNIDASLHKTEPKEQLTVGGFESVELPDYSDEPLIAKIDTGAYSGAIYATQVRKKVDETGRAYLSFALNGDQAHRCTAYDFYQRNVRSAHGHVQKRYVIRTYINIQGHLYETDIGLSNRANMKYPMLIGRKFLRDKNILVDVRKNEKMDHEKELLG